MSTQYKLILTPLKKAVASLEEAVLLPETVIVRDATIQRFEYTFELAVKMIKRHLETLPGTTDMDELNFRDLIRRAAEAGLVSDPEAWFEYREARNITSHAYDEKKAALVYATAKRFAQSADELTAELERRV